MQAHFINKLFEKGKLFNEYGHKIIYIYYFHYLDIDTLTAGVECMKPDGNSYKIEFYPVNKIKTKAN